MAGAAAVASRGERPARVWRDHGESADRGDKQATQKPTAFMMRTKFAGGIVLKVGDHRQRAHALAPVQQLYLVARRVPAPFCTALQSGYPDEEVPSRSNKCHGCQR
jgi:hypothetical protein